MRILGILAVAILFIAPERVSAQSWFEYVNREDRFSVNFPSQPEINDLFYHSTTGSSIPARKFETRDGDALYTATPSSTIPAPHRKTLRLRYSTRQTATAMVVGK